VRVLGHDGFVSFHQTSHSPLLPRGNTRLMVRVNSHLATIPKHSSRCGQINPFFQRLIVKRYLAALMPAREYDETEMSFSGGRHSLKTKGQVTTSLGWRALEDMKSVAKI
jgi:DNA topoisomerase IA